MTSNLSFTTCQVTVRHLQKQQQQNSSFVNQYTNPPVFDVREVPCGGPGAVEPVAAGPEVAGEETEDIAPATETD